MKKLTLLLAVLLAALFAASCAVRTELPSASDTPDWNNPPAESGTQAVYIYMCGSDLETKTGAAAKNIAEMLSADIPENTSVVIETGGSKKWRNYDISSDHLSRYVIENGELILKELLEDASMGNSDTLSGFLEYCVTEHPAERMGFIFWDHGGCPVRLCRLYDSLRGDRTLGRLGLRGVFAGLWRGRADRRSLHKDMRFLY